MGMVKRNIQNMPEPLKEMIELYKAFVDAKRGLQNKKVTQAYELTRITRLEAKIDAMWPQFDQGQQKTIVAKLTQDGYMSDDLSIALTLFDGRIDMTPPPIPCRRIP